MRSPSLRPRSFASCGLIQAVGSHVTFVSGLGNSCSQPLLAKRPSHTVGSGRKMISSPPVAGGVVVLPCAIAGGLGAAAPACCVAGAPAGALGTARLFSGAGGTAAPAAAAPAAAGAAAPAAGALGAGVNG